MPGSAVISSHPWHTLSRGWKRTARRSFRREKRLWLYWGSGRRHGLPDRHLYQWPRRLPLRLGVFAFRLPELFSNTMITYMSVIGIAGERFALAVLCR